jgi:hypothetical protein
MKSYLAQSLFQIYLWGMILIPALHHAGIILPHHCEQENLFKSHYDCLKNSAEDDSSMLFQGDDDCIICAFACTLIETPETSDLNLTISAKTEKQCYCLINSPQLFIAIFQSRAPPEVA